MQKQSWREFLQQYPLEISLFLFLYISQFYYIYRYIFKINSTATSPSYSNGGLFEKVFKYAIALAFLLLYVAIILWKKTYKEQTKILWQQQKKHILLVVAFVVYILVNVLFLHTGGIQVIKNSATYDFVIKFLVFIPFIFLSPFVLYNKWHGAWRNFFISALIANFLFTLVQVILYITMHRLPALAYVTGSVRFGGMWDDPNGISLFYLFMLIFFVFDQWRQKDFLRYIAIGVIVLLLYMAASFTAFGIFFALLLLFFFYYHKKEALMMLISAIVIVGFSFMIPHYDENNFLLKIPSASQHLYEVTHLKIFLLTSPITLKDGLVIEPPVVPTTVVPTPLPTAVMPSSAAKTATKKILQHPTTTAHIVKPGKDNKLMDYTVGHADLVFSEDFYKQFSHNFGLIGVILFVWLLWEVLQGVRKIAPSPVIWIFVCVTLLGSLGLPYLEIFPINLYFWIFLGYLLFY